MSTVSGVSGSTFNPVSTTWMFATAEDWYLLWSSPIVPRSVAMPPVMTSA